MNLLHFEEIYIEGFRSVVQPLVYKFDTKGISTISGLNGSGKTTIFSALTWCLYGKTLKASSSPEPYKFIQGKKFQGTLVKVTLKIRGQRYVIFRSHKFKGDFGLGKNTTTIAIFTDGAFMPGIRDLPDGKAKVAGLLEHSYELFINSVMFGQKLKRLIQETGPTRNKVLEEAFDVVFIREGQKITEERLQKKVKELQTTENNCTLLQLEVDNLRKIKSSKKETLASLKVQVKNIKDDHEKAKLKDLNGLVKRIKHTKDRLKLVNKVIETLSPFRQKENETKNTIFKQELYIENLKGDIDDMLRDIEDSRPDRTQKKCPTCGNVTSLTPQRYKDIMEIWRRKVERAKEEKSNNLKAIEIEEKRIGVLRKKAKSYENKCIKLDSYLKEKNVLEADLKRCLVDQKEIHNRRNPTGLKGLEEMMQSLRDEINQRINADLRMKKGERKGLMMELELLQEERKNLEWVYKEALSNKGLKSYVFHEKIKALNRVLMEYSEVLGYQIVFSIDLESRSKEFKTRIYRNSQIRDYNDLSGGQQQLVDVGTAFAFHELKEATMDCNILCMDEIFEHLDSENIEIISEFIKMKARKKSVHLITHLEEFNLASTTTLKLKLNKREQTIVVGAL